MSHTVRAGNEGLEDVVGRYETGLSLRSDQSLNSWADGESSSSGNRQNLLGIANDTFHVPEVVDRDEQTGTISLALVVPSQGLINCPCCLGKAMNYGIGKNPNRPLLKHIKKEHKLKCETRYKCRFCSYVTTPGYKYQAKYIKAHLRENHMQMTMQFDQNAMEQKVSSVQLFKNRLHEAAPTLHLMRKDDKLSHTGTQKEESAQQTVRLNDDAKSNKADNRNHNGLMAMEGPEAWFSDEIIHNYLKLLIPENHTFTHLDPILWSVIREGDYSPILQKLELSTQSCLLPICENSHWTLTVWGPIARTVLFVDPLRQQPPRKLVKVTKELNYEIIRPVKPPPLQTDGHNCGPHVCLAARDIVLCKDWYTADEVLNLRGTLRALCGLTRTPPAQDKPAPATNLSVDDAQGKTEDGTPKLMEIAIEPLQQLQQAARPITKKVQMPHQDTKDQLINKIRSWFDAQMEDYILTKDFDHLEWITDVLTAGIHMASVGDKTYVDKILKRSAPPKRLSGEMSTQTERSKVKKIKTQSSYVSPKTIQSLYKSDRRKAFEKIVKKESADCQIDMNTLEKHFREASCRTNISAETLAELSNKMTRKQIPPCIEEHFTHEEVARALKTVKDTAPGVDGLKYSHLRWFDPGNNRLARLFNECLHHRKVPKHWKEAETILIYKGGDTKNPSNWRPISLMPTIYKLYSSLWSKRISSVPGIISRCQKGFQEREGCAENISILRTALDAARGLKAQLSVAWLDLKNAFGSVPHELILHSLRSTGFPQVVQDVIGDFYNESTIRIKCGMEYSNAIPVLSGVKQGDPISPILFNLCLENVLRRSLDRNRGHKLLSQRIKALAFADDLAILADSPNELQKELTQLDNDCARLNLIFKPAKCASLTLVQGKPSKDKLNVRGEPIRTMSSTDAYKYLGVMMSGASNRSSHGDLLEKMTKELEHVTRSDLAPWQKLDAIKGFILPKLTYMASNATPKLTELGAFDDKVMAAAKQIHHIPMRGGPREYVQIAVKDGGLGLLSPKLTALAAFFASTMKKLWSNERFVRTLHWEYLHKVVQTHVKHYPSMDELAEYLNKGSNLAGNTTGFSVFSRIRECIRVFTKNADAPLHSLKFIPDGTNLKIAIRSLAESEPVIIAEHEAHKLQKAIKKAMQEGILQKFLSSKPAKSRTTDVTRKYPGNNKFVKTGGLVSFSAHKFVHAARLDLLPCNAKAEDQLKQCRRCDYAKETLPHIINHCNHQLGSQITQRHDNVLFAIGEEIAKGTRKSWTLQLDTKAGPGQDRPDIVLTSPDKKETVIADVVVAFENKCEAMTDAGKRKIVKYRHLVEYYNSLGTQAEVFPIVVGSLGSWWPANRVSLNSLGIPVSQQKTLIKSITARVLEDSKNIYWRHIHGDHYKEPKYLSDKERFNWFRQNKQN